jgi:Xaa-Pro dipeptidase
LTPSPSWNPDQKEGDMIRIETGARWFTQPAHSVDDPFGLEK